MFKVGVKKSKWQYLEMEGVLVRSDVRFHLMVVMILFKKFVKRSFVIGVSSRRRVEEKISIIL
jgi:hypothetical protein